MYSIRSILFSTTKKLVMRSLNSVHISTAVYLENDPRVPVSLFSVSTETSYIPERQPSCPKYDKAIQFWDNLGRQSIFVCSNFVPTLDNNNIIKQQLQERVSDVHQKDESVIYIYIYIYIYYCNLFYS